MTYTPQDPKIAVLGLGLGYVGLPLAVAFGGPVPTVGFDISQKRIDVHDPWVDPTATRIEHGFDLKSEPDRGGYDAIVLAVAHHQFVALGPDGVRALTRNGGIIYDLKGVLPAGSADLSL